MNMIKYFLFVTLYLKHIHAITTFSIKNNCHLTLWAAAVPGGGQHLDRGETWSLNVPDKTMGQIWARTGCSFNATGNGKCLTGDCNELLQCISYGESPYTAVRYVINRFNDLDLLDISLINGFNVPVRVTADGTRCNLPVRCTADINEDCPKKLRVPQGCSDPCAVFRTDKYCCTSGNCGPTSYSRFFQRKCPNTYTYPKDDQPFLTNCPAGSNYTVVFCP